MKQASATVLSLSFKFTSFTKVFTWIFPIGMSFFRLFWHHLKAASQAGSTWFHLKGPEKT